MVSSALAASARVRRALDAAAVAWVVLCLVLGLLVAREVRELQAIPAQVDAAGRQIETLGGRIGEAGGVPVIGGGLEGVAGAVRDAGVATRERGAEAGEAVDALAALLGVVVFAVPVLPLLGGYLPLRVTWAREERALGALEARAGGDPELRRLLRERELVRMPARRLARLPGRPWAGEG